MQPNLCRESPDIPQAGPRKALLLFRGQILLLDRGDHYVVWIHHFVEMNLRHFRQQLIRIEFRQTVILVDPMHQFGEGDAHGIIQRTISTNRHNGVVVLKLRPGDGAPLDHAQLHARLQRNLYSGAGDFSIAHGGMAVADVEQSSLDVDREVNGIADARFWRIHVAAEFRGHHGTARLAIGGRDSDAAEERMHGNLHREIGIERLEQRRVRGVIDVVKPDALGKRRMQHGRVVCLVNGAKSGSERAHARVAIDLQVENLDGQRVAGLRTLYEKWPGQRIVAFGHAERVAGFPERVPEAVERVGIEDVARLQTSHRLGRGEKILHVVDGGGVVDDVARLPVKRARSRQQQARQRNTAAFQLHGVSLILPYEWWSDGRTREPALSEAEGSTANSGSSQAGTSGSPPARHFRTNTSERILQRELNQSRRAVGLSDLADCTGATWISGFNVRIPSS